MMHIKITPRQLSGCTDFVPQPARLHLGSQNAQGVDTLAFDLPPEWAGKSVALHIQQADGSLPAPLLLDELVTSGALRSGQRALCAGFGGGLTWAGALLQLA